MTSSEDDFDARLGAAFARADADITPDPAFTQRVQNRLGKTLNPRTLVLSGAGAAGSAIAATQMDRLAGGIQFHNPLLAHLFDLVGSQSIVVLVFTLIAATFAYALPRVRI